MGRMGVVTPAERAILRIREEMTARNLTQRDLADRLKCSQGRIAKMLKGRVELRVNDLDELARAVGLSTIEALRDRGLEFYAELTPSEVRLLERIRQRPGLLQGVLLILGLRAELPIVQRDTQKRRKVGRPLNTERAKLEGT